MKSKFTMTCSWLAVLFFTATASHAQWSLSGNAGTNPPTQFIGTTDAKDLVFKIHNVFSGTIDYDFGNTALGYQSLSVVSPGSENSAFGDRALPVVTGIDNAAFGSVSLYNCTSGGGNTAMGVAACFSIADGDYNTGIGFGALEFNTSGWYNTAVGTYADVSAGSYTNSTALGYSAMATGSNMVRLGNSSVTSIGGYAGWSNISDGRYKKNVKANVPGLAFIKQLHPVTYNLDAAGIDHLLSSATSSGKNAKPLESSALEQEALRAKEQILYSGFIAQEVEATAKKMGYDFSGVDAPKNDKDLYSLRYADFVVPLVKAMQELSGTNDSLKTQISDLQAKNEQLQLQINNILQQISSLKSGFAPSLNGKAWLKQNAPNPFNNSTIIGYNVPPSSGHAQVVISDVSGQVLKAVSIENKGEGNISIPAGQLAAGSYFYTLIIDGARADTRQMIINK